jgi:uncharacterized protein YuzE
MRFNYDKETDSLYINLVDIPGVDSFEIAPDYIVDKDSTGKIIGLEVLNVKEKIDIHSFIFDKIPVRDVQFINQPQVV